MEAVQYRIGTVTFADESCPTWGTRSVQILNQMARWSREGWRVSRLNTGARVRLDARGFCMVLERPLRKSMERRPSRRRGGRWREAAA